MKSADARARRERHVPFFQILAGEAHVGAGARPRPKGHPISLAGDVFLHDDRVGAVRDRRARENAARCSGNQRRGQGAHATFTYKLFDPRSVALERARRHGVAVHGARRERWRRASRDDRAREHAAERLAKCDAFARDGLEVREDETARFIERNHACFVA